MSVQVASKPLNGELRVRVGGELDFEAARELLLVCKARWQEGGTQSIVVDMAGVTGLSSSAVGSLMLLSELVGESRFKLNLENCSEDVCLLFTSGILDKYLKAGVA